MQLTLWPPSALAQLVCNMTLLQCLEGTAVQQILDARSEPRCYCPEDDSAKAEKGGQAEASHSSKDRKNLPFHTPPHPPPLTLRILNQTKIDAVTEHFTFR